MKYIITFTIVSVGLLFNFRPLVYSQGLGHDYFPQINRLNPDLIAYEETSRNNTRDLVVTFADDNTSSNLRNEVFRIKCFEDSYVDPLGRRVEGSQGVCSHFNWRPILDENGNYWFTFINNENNRIGVGFISKNLTCLDSEQCSTFYLDITSNKGISRPKWSPDGRLIMYNDGFEIRLIDDLYKVVRNRDGGLGTLISEPIGLGFFPEWSPNGKFIAYEKQQNEISEGIDRVEVSEILILNYESYVRGNPLTFNLKDIEERNPDFVVNNRFKPSWTKDSKYLNYLTQVNTDANNIEQTWYSMAVQIQETENSIRGIRFHRSFLSQISNFYRNSELRTGISTVQLNYRDETDRPFAVNVNEAFMQTRDLFSFTHILSRIEEPFFVNIQLQNSLNGIPLNNSNVIHLDAFAYSNKIRLAYAEQDRDRYSFKFTDLEITGNTFLNNNLYRPKEIRRNDILLRAIAFPGLAQFYKGEYEKALVYGGIGSILVIYGVNHVGNNKRDIINFNFSAPFSLALLTGIALHSYSIYDALQGLPVIKGFNPNVGNINLSIDAITNPRHNLIFPGVRLNIWN